MAAKMYIVSFDVLTIFETERLRLLFGSDSTTFSKWWNHLPFVFLVMSDKTALEITGVIHEHFKEARFIVGELNLTNTNGILKEPSWNWIVQREDELADESVA